MTPAILRAGEASAAGEVGGKAASLSALSRAGFDVPAFFVAMPGAFHADGLEPAAERALLGALAELGPGPFAVRSSGRDEDGANNSHAGQFLSLLQVEAEHVPAAALQVWRSGSTPTLEAYRAARGLDSRAGAPAVIVQRMVAARAAGVAFSADPVGGRRDRILVSATAGLGDRLVGGEVDGDDYVLDSRTNEQLSGPAGGGILSDADLDAVADLARRVAQHQKAPQDIEWAWQGERLFLLQARPITTPLLPAPIDDPLSAVFDNSNIVESYPGLVSPLTYSFAQYAYARVYRAFTALVGVDAETIRANGAVFENMLGRIDGRVYYNLANWYRALALLPGFSINRSHMETMMGVGAPLPEAVAAGIGPSPARGAALLHEYGRVARMAVRLAGEAFRLRRTIGGFHARLDRAVARTPAEIGAMPLTELAREYRRVESDLLDRWDAPLVNDFLCMVAFGASRKLLERWCGERGPELHNAIMIGQGEIISAEPVRRIAHMGRLAAADPVSLAALARGDRSGIPGNGELARDIDDYILKFGDRCAEELKLESVTLAADPAPLLAAVAAAAATGRSGSAGSGQAGSDAFAEAFRGRPLRRVVARLVVGWAKRRVRDRENLRFERTRVFGHARRVFLAMGRQFASHGVLEDERDILCLTVQEVLGAIEGSGLGGGLRGLAALRKAEMARAAERPDPPERIMLEGAAILNLRGAAGDAATPPCGARTRSGTGCSAGTVRARARVVRDPRTDALERGDVLVARSTDPGWIAVFSNAAAIVVERGSLLSHSAIVAREMGIPCVVGLKGALDWIADGELIEVDGARGTVSKADG